MIVPVNEFNPDVMKKFQIQHRKRGNQSNNKKIKYMDCVCAFDIETSYIEEIDQNIMYIWQFQIDEVCTVIGRTWEEYVKFLYTLMDAIPEDATIVVYVHNLSYEFQYLRGIYDFKPEDVFVIDSRKILKAVMFDKRIEYRCSYMLTNMSLKEFTNKMDVQHKKLDDFEYTDVRYPWTELSDRELEYCVNDVWGLVEALKKLLNRDWDILASVPLTSTGYVRRDVKTAMRSVSHNYIPSILPDYELYTLLREAFRGGNTHSNRYYSNYTLENVHSADRSSSYPDVICNCPFPIRKFFHAGSITEDELYSLINNRHKAVIMRCTLCNVELKDPYWGCPYLAKAKCRETVDGVFDNGRILSATYLETTITDIDLKILQMEYNFDLVPNDVWYSGYGQLPLPIIKTVQQYYTKKTTLKGVKGQEIFYNKNKAQLNSIYGMMAQDPVKMSVLFSEGSEEVYKLDESTSAEALLEKSNRKAFTSYAWGVWTCAWARLRLEEGIQMAHYQNDSVAFVYSDTDSVKYIGDIDWTEYNEKRKNDSIKSGSYATDPNGITHYMGVYEMEDTYDKFRTMGAKKYVGTHGDNIEITVAGVGKKAGAKELEQAGGIDAFQSGMIFREAGGLQAIYNDYPSMKEWEHDGHTVIVTPNIVLADSTYTLDVTDEYEELMTNAQGKFGSMIERLLRMNNIEVTKTFTGVLW